MSTESDPPAEPYDAGSDTPLERQSPERRSRRRDAAVGEHQAADPEPGTADPDAEYEQAAVGEPPGRMRSENMLPQRPRRRLVLETLLVRLIATGGVIGIGVAIAAIMVSSNSKGWLVGLVVSIVTVVLSAILWSSRQV